MSESGRTEAGPKTPASKARGSEARPKAPQMDVSARARLQGFARRHGQPDPPSDGEVGGGKKDTPEERAKNAERAAKESSIKSQADKAALQEALNRAVLAESALQSYETRAGTDKTTLQAALDRAVQAESNLKRLDTANSNLRTELGSTKDTVIRLRAELEQVRAQASAGARREGTPPPGAGDSKGYYKTLGLDPHIFDGLSDAQAERLAKSIYRAQSMIYHPDILGSGNEQKMKDIDNAYDTFKKSDLRRAYR